ncbi:flagellar hook capping FlgD N-terminal domain-containing protein [Desulfosporosinus sp. OT]|uniref:flagellar hook capping FlgD N-terminal domain-containing protein n=1 Tax=Desulfosporosinus sp. OT TaxID=913865 RepID=UPI000223B144|nr:flagellar hook capping FlgD N-terminal domain-containing protein [Desulfosporosinus sp. OT]EGW36758.1 flagellar hook capping family protein [Desulfosporosinus sp. OT]
MSNTISGTSSTTNTGSTTNTSTTAGDSLGKDDFLQLLVAQMQNQDPLNPTDSKESIAQLAQFSALEQMTNISTSMDALNATMTYQSQLSSLSQGAALISKWVGGVDTDGETTIEGTVEAVNWLDGDPKLQVRKADGTLVDLELGLITSVQDQQPSTNDDTTDTADTADTTETTDTVDTAAGAV